MDELNDKIADFAYVESAIFIKIENYQNPPRERTPYMASIYKKNMEALKNCNPLIQSVEPYIHNCDVGQHVRLQDGVLQFQYGSEYYQLTSKDKNREADYLLRDLDEYKDYLIVLFGMANVNLLRKIVQNTSEGTRVLVFEPNLFVMKYTLKNENLVDVLETGKFAFIAGEERTMKSAVMVYTAQKWDNLVQNLVAISLPNYYLYQDYRLKCIQMVSNEIEHHLKRLGTSLEDMLDGLQNHYRNVDQAMTCNSLSELKGKYTGYPAIIVASGPSLDKNIHQLKEAQDKALIITCDASYAACVSNGVKPDAIASIERYSPTYDFFYKDREFPQDLVLVGPALLWPELLENFPGKKMLMAKNYSGLEGWWSELLPNLQYLDMGHSCATAAYAVAVEAGCSPVILIGQDLAYTDDKFHTDSIHEQFGSANVGGTVEGVDDLMVEGIDGKPVRTSDTFNLFRFFFEENIAINGVPVVDATEGGAKIAGSEIRTLTEAIGKYCTRPLPYHMNDILEERQISREDASAKYDEIIEAAKKILDGLKEVQQRVMGHFEVLMKYKDFDYENASEDDLYHMVLNMQEADKLVTFLVEEKSELVSYYQQIIKQTIIYVKKIGNRLTPENVKRNWELQVNLMQMVDISTVATSQRFTDLIRFIEEKKNEREVH